MCLKEMASFFVYQHHSLHTVHHSVFKVCYSSYYIYLYHELLVECTKLLLF